MVYGRNVEEETLELGVRGMIDDALILYDRQTDSLWNQLGGEAVRGPLEGRKLERIPSQVTTWKQWRALHPDTSVYLKPETLYRSRFIASELSKALSSPAGQALEDSDLVVAIEVEGRSKAFPLSPLRDVVNDAVGESPVLLLVVAESSTVQAFSRDLDGRVLNFHTLQKGVLRDEETGSRWDALSGEAVAGESKGARLEPVPFIFVRWGTWKQNRPATELYTGER